MVRWYQAMVNSISLARLVRSMVPAGFALTRATESICKLLAIVGENNGDVNGTGFDQALEESLSALG